MIRFSFSLFLSLSLVFSPVAFAAKTNHTEEKAKVLQAMMEEFRKMCVGADGKVLLGSVVIDRSEISKDGRVINCQDEAKRLTLMIESLKKEVESKSRINDTVMCTPDDPQIQAILADIGSSMKLAESVTKNQGAGQCMESEQDMLACTKDVACNVWRSFESTTSLSSLHPNTKNSCITASKSNCGVEIIAGVIKDVVFNVKGMWELIKLAGTGVKNAATATWDHFTKAENASSEAALLASAQSPSMIDLFKKDPLQFLTIVGKEVWRTLGVAIKKNFGCEKWSGRPHFSTCEKEMSGWDCATCNQKMNAICGVGGALGGEVLFAYLTGGTLSIAGKTGGKGLQALSKAHAAVVKAIPSVQKTETAVVSAGKFVGLKGYEITTRVLESQLAQLIINAGRTAGTGAFNVLSKVAKTAPLSITIKVLSGATTPVTKYLELMDKGFTLGMNHGNSLFDKANRGFYKLSEVARGKVLEQQIDEIIVNSRQYEDVSQEVIQARLKAKGIEFETVTLNDGSKGTRIKSRPECGRSNMIIK